MIPLPVFLVNGKNCKDLNFSHFFCELGLKMLGPQQWQLLHIEKDDITITKLGETKEKSIWKAFLPALQDAGDGIAFKKTILEQFWFGKHFPT
jgi:hypothetical protein